MNAQITKKQVLILGGGFGGLNAALEFERQLKRDQTIEVTLINCNNYSLFTPMLHEVATAELDPSNIVVPMHKLLRRVKFISGKVSAIDLKEKKVSVQQTAELEIKDKNEIKVAHDKLLLAFGPTTNFFDLPGVEANSLTMKSLTDAMILRNAIVGSLEAASIAKDETEKMRLLTFAVAGGGFAGVETIGSINDFVREAILNYPQLDAKDLRVLLIHATTALLPEFRGELSSYTLEKLVERGVEVRLNTRVIAANYHEITFANGEKVPTGVFIWTAGVKPDSLIENLPFQKEKGRILTDQFLQAAGSSDVWAIGDCAAIPNVEDGGFYAPLAQCAQRQGTAAAKNIIASINNNNGEKKAFRFKLLGQLASIGFHSGVANVFDFRFSGLLAWLLWRATYLFKLPTFEKKLRVLLNWTLGSLFSHDIVQFVSMETANFVEERKKKLFAWQEKELAAKNHTKELA